MNLHVERVGGDSGLLALKDEWGSLLEEQPDASIFHTWDWISTFWRHPEPNWEPYVLEARDEQGRLRGIAPWMRSQHRYGPLRVARVAFTGSNYAYRIHTDLIAQPQDKDEVLMAFLGYLRAHRGDWNVLDFESVSETSSLRDCLPAAASWARYAEGQAQACRYVLLPETWNAFEMKQLSANRRQQLRARRRKLERDYPEQVHFYQVTDQKDLDRALDGLVSLHQKRWHARGQRSSFENRAFAGFHREMAPLALERGWLRFYLLEVAGEIIAAQYCFLYRGVLFDYQKSLSLDRRWDSYSPGQLLQAYVLQQAIVEGAHEFDMGHEAGTAYDYKFSWTDRARAETHPQLSSGLKGHAWLYGGVLLRGARLRSHRVLPENVRQSVNRVLSGLASARTR